jgi:hypothetical protein
MVSPLLTRLLAFQNLSHLGDSSFPTLPFIPHYIHLGFLLFTGQIMSSATDTKRMKKMKGKPAERRVLPKEESIYLVFSSQDSNSF